MRHLLLFTLLPLASVAVAQTPPPVAPSMSAPPRTILVRGTAERELDPEKLDVLMTYRFSDNVKESERTQSQEESLRQVLSRAGIAPEKLVLEELSASGYGGLSKVGNSTVALTKTYRLTLDNRRQLHTLVPQLVQTGADNLRFVNLRNGQLAATKADLTTLAVVDARQKAGLAVKAAGGQLGGVLTLVEVLPDETYVFRPIPMSRSLTEMDKAYQSYQERIRPSVELITPTLRKIKVQVAYDVVFEVKP